jgi:hypothetical protein
MKIVVIGGSGVSGSKLVNKLRELTFAKAGGKENCVKTVAGQCEPRRSQATGSMSM